MSIISLTNVSKNYLLDTVEVRVLKDVNISIKKGEMVAIMGPSGSGKSTLMNMIGLLDRPTSGTLRLDGKEIRLTMSDKALAHLRSEKIGFVFQSFNLLPRLTALANVMMPASYAGTASGVAKEKAIEILGRVGLKDRVTHRPTEMSGGERQRVAIARALINNPEIILADEPTGNLDSKSGKEVMQVLRDLNNEGKTIIIITHDQTIADYCSRTVRILDGAVEERHG